MDGALVTLNSWIQGERIYRLENGAFVDTELQPVDPAEDEVRLVAEEVRVPAADGVMIPMSIVYRDGLKRDDSNPCWLNAYGSYGYKSTPRFDPAMVAWFERGGIFATAQVRGGGAYGEEWHRAGMKRTKPNTWRDFIACGEWLISNRYTSARNLAISGRSAGGITVGRALTERPDVFGAALGGVGVFNPLRSEFSQNGVANIPEFGTITDEEDFLALKEMDSCQHVEKGRRYPAVLLTTGYSDVRVPVWQPAKFAARLQAAGAGTVLLRVDYDIGHGAGMTKQQRNELLADEMAFFLNAFEAPEEKRD